MKKVIFISTLVVVLLLLSAGSAAAGGPYRRVVIPGGLSVAIGLPNGVTAFVLEPYTQAIYLPWSGEASPGGQLQRVKSGDPVLLHRDWAARDEPLWLRVTWVQIIAAEDEESVVLARVSERFFALITYPPCGNENQRLVVWAAADHQDH